jgi:hypothetical protein
MAVLSGYEHYFEAVRILEVAGPVLAASWMWVGLQTRPGDQ